jgi:hypothetical protein
MCLFDSPHGECHVDGDPNCDWLTLALAGLERPLLQRGNGVVTVARDDRTDVRPEIERTRWASARLTDGISNSASTNPSLAEYYLQPFL